MGRAYANLKQYEIAEKEFEIAIQINPLNKEAIRNLRGFLKLTNKTKLYMLQKRVIGALMGLLLITNILFIINSISEHDLVLISGLLVSAVTIASFIILWGSRS